MWMSIPPPVVFLRILIAASLFSEGARCRSSISSASKIDSCASIFCETATFPHVFDNGSSPAPAIRGALTQHSTTAIGAVPPYLKYTSTSRWKAKLRRDFTRFRVVVDKAESAGLLKRPNPLLRLPMHIPNYLPNTSGSFFSLTLQSGSADDDEVGPCRQSLKREAKWQRIHQPGAPSG